MKQKVAIASCYFKKNYGSQLQAYATQKILNELNVENKTIDISKNIDFKNGKKKYYINQIFNYNFIKTKFGMIKLKFDKIINPKLKSNIQIRNEKFSEFEKNFNLMEPCNTYKELSLKMKNDNYTDVLVGSDQLWLPVNVVADYYTLNWVPDEINKISYSTSFGFSKIPLKYANKYKTFLNRINFLSTRENTGIKIIKELTNREAEIVCDPTLLFNKDEWMDIQNKERIIKEKYIFCYFLGKNIVHRKFVEKLKKETGYKILSINHCDEYVKYSDKFADIIPYDIGPGEFLNLIRNAEYVCTDSFHGTVFALINNIDFFTFKRFSSKEKASTNSRIFSLLEKVELQDRLISGEENVKSLLDKKIDYEVINNNIESFRKNSIEFLKKALKIEE